MAGLWSIIVPESGTNLITNPSFETNVTSWTAGGTNTFAQSTAQGFKGAYSGLLTYGNTATGMVAYTPSPSASTTYHLSAWVYVPANWDGGNIYLDAINYGGATETINNQYTHGTSPTAQWIYLETKIAFDVDVTGTIGLTTSSAPTAGRTLYLDAVQFEQNASYATTYIDGDRGDGYAWTGTAHASTSTRSSQVRSGGRVRNLDDYYVTVRYSDGIGMPPAQHYAQSAALLPGATYQGRRVMPRAITLTSVIPGTTYENLHERRKDLIDLIKPDLVEGDQPVVLRYTGADSDRPVEISATYDAGMEFGATHKIEQFGLRLIAYDPWWYEIGGQSIALTPQATIADADYVVKRVAGVWANINTAFNGDVNAIVRGKDGCYYIGGAFTNVGDANGDYIVKYDPAAGTLASLGTGMNAAVNALAVSPEGYIYAGGSFSSAGGVLNTNLIAYWNGAAWNAIGGTGIVSGGGGGAVYALAFDQAGVLYAGGSFTDHVDANGDNITKYNGAWASMGTGCNSYVRALAVGPDNTLYVGGEFTLAGGVANTAYIAKWNGTAWTPLSTGMDDIVYALAVDGRGYLYAGGDFDTAGGTTAAKIACWNGSGWSVLGTGCNDVVEVLTFDEDGLLYVGGLFTTAGGLTLADRMAIWNGTTWAHVPVNLPGSPQVYAITTYGDDLYIGYNTSGTAYGSVITSTTNSGTAVSYPSISVYNPSAAAAKVKYLRNRTTGDILWLNYSMLDMEKITINLEPNNRSITSDFFGPVWRAVLRNSDLTSFNLLPGSNDIELYVSYTGGVAPTCLMTWKRTHWSADGAAA